MTTAEDIVWSLEDETAFQSLRNRREQHMAHKKALILALIRKLHTNSHDPNALVDQWITNAHEIRDLLAPFDRRIA